ncbi:terpenoid cyclases/protein prenyltransferase alpha-alpha toroid [Staphylotrichum tortipilum]|uniref:Terpenoid cyclases/protein prenyltransferase alpha-alpha toroid n=1 Tax=Staphylotrichum tortipilum TaxID=2831512 RepID=A0AAN6MI22_9PEZI|nr:terpenoid cyclases/protein prenyltransferase alpha-alpha toroid [Staphylotrichum longicolle]
MANNTPDAAEPVLDIARHLKYWKMCFQAPLPHHYLSNEGNRMALAYFIINSITILTPPPSVDNNPTQSPPLIPPEDRPKLRAWVLSHQQPGGGFAATSSLVFPTQPGAQREPETGGREATDGPGLANLPATLFALQLLAMLADSEDEAGAFGGVDRVQTLRWLRRLQRADGSFGEVLRRMPGNGWFIGGGYDMRYCYIAASVRWTLRGDVKEGEKGWVEDIDTEGLARYILRSQTYDGGFAGSSQEEPHAGYAYCAISALSLLDRPLTTATPHPQTTLHSSIRDMPGLLHWLASRQFVYLEPPPTDSDADDYEEQVNFLLPARLSDLALATTTTPGPEGTPAPLVGCNGRANKVADTCYTWWVGAALSILDRGELLDWRGARRFLLQKMAHRIGGFSKHPGGPPDVYHGCFGLTALAVMGEPGLAELDSALAVPARTVKVIERAREALVERGREEGKGLGREAVEMGVAMRGGRPRWLDAVGG